MGAGPGRPKGTPNKLTKTVKQAIEEAFDRVGGTDWLVELATEDKKAFVTLLGKLIPTNLKVEGGLQIEHLFTPSQLRRMADEQEIRDAQVIDG